MTNTSIGHGDRHRACREPHVMLNSFPDVEDLAAAKRAEVMLAFQKDAVLQAIPDSASVVLDTMREFFSSQVCLRHNGLH